MKLIYLIIILISGAWILIIAHKSVMKAGFSIHQRIDHLSLYFIANSFVSSILMSYHNNLSFFIMWISNL